MLTGREAEQEQIDQLLERATAGNSGVLVLRGDPGIGKTTLIEYAASRAGPMRVLRATGIEAENELGFAGLYSPAGLPCRELAGLGRDAAERLVEAIAGTKPAPELTRRLHAETGGNPLALAELSAVLTTAQLDGAELPEAPLEPGTAIRQRFAARLERLSPQSKTALLVTAAAGRCAVTAVNEAVARLGDGDSTAFFDEAETAGLIRLTNDGVEFSHPLLRSLDQAVSAALEAGRYDEASRAAERMADLAERSDETARFLADLAHGGLAWLRGEAEPGMTLIQRAMARTEANPALAARPERQLDLASAWCDAGRPDRARPCAERAVELARSEGAGGRLPRALAWASWLDGESGRWSRALAYGSQALDLALATGQSYLACYAYATLANVEAAQGRDDDCLRHANGAEQLALELSLRKLEVQARRSRALLDLGRGRLEEAIARYEGLRRLTADAGIAHPYYSTIPDLIEAYARVGAVDQARALLPEFLASVPGRANPQSAARAARCRGLVAADDFDTPFLEAIALHERGDVVFQHARTHLTYGERLRRAQRRRDARVQLRAAAEIFDRLDARPWAERARAELAASGETLARAGDGAEQLTPQELQIALLVTEGRTNAEVGRAVFLSTRTVEFHLSRAYRKLGVSSRTELTRLLATAGTVAG